VGGRACGRVGRSVTEYSYVVHVESKRRSTTSTRTSMTAAAEGGECEGRTTGTRRRVYRPERFKFDFDLSKTLAATSLPYCSASWL
jgi:hypothetical protein